MVLVASRAEIEMPGLGASAANEHLTTRLVSQAIRRAQEGDREALSFLYSRYADNVCGYVRSIVHDSHEAEDVTQQVFAKLINVIGKYEEREVPFLAWILRVARNLAVDHLRRQRMVPVEEVRTNGTNRDQIDGERMTDLREALAELPKDQREVLVLRHFAGLSPPEIATLTGRSEGSIHGLHHRGRRALRTALSDRDATPATLGTHPPNAVSKSVRAAPATMTSERPKGSDVDQQSAVSNAPANDS
ncbi:MAG TPA: sigma-70 family RNA polymerase sigma factor [Solirubrobacteraceae bacterium]|nr:sigma-70 family RNA polymerase sigma factor [Solirubrobacteraceae bacterium]